MDHQIKFCRNLLDSKNKSKEKQKGTIRAMAFSPDGKTLATGGQDEHLYILYIWNVETGDLQMKKLLVRPLYVDVNLDLVRGLSLEE